jgi:hypothetical protein
MRTRTGIAIALAGALGALAAPAAPAASAAERVSGKGIGSTSLRPPVPLDREALSAMLRADRDKDGTLTREELEHHDIGLARRFEEVDGDRDRRLTLYEFEKLLAAPETSASR